MIMCQCWLIFHGHGSCLYFRVRDAALDYFNDTLNQLSVNVNNMRQTVKSLRPSANDLPSVRVQLASLKVSE